MPRIDDENAPWTRQLLVSVAALLAVALVIGGVVSVVALGAAKVSGIDDTQPQATSRPSLVMPSGEPTTTTEAFPNPAGASATTSPSTSESPSPTPAKKAPRITLQASPDSVSANERIDLFGTYRGGSGRRLQVQRFEGDWVDFPVSASVNGESFHTYIFTGREGTNRF